MTERVYTTHPTYTGPGCAHCGKLVSEHGQKLECLPSSGVSDCRICGKSEEEHRIMTQKCSVNHSYCPPFKMLDKETHANFMQKMDDLEEASVLTEGQPNDPFYAARPDVAGKRKLDLRLEDEGGPQSRPIATHPQDERPKFEEWVVSTHRCEARHLDRDKHKPEEYDDWQIQEAWNCWQAALASRRGN